MARERNLNNLKTEKEGILILKKHISNFIVPTSEQRKRIYRILDIDYRKYSRSVDGIILNVPSLSDVKNEEDLILVEIKTTKAKNIIKLPYGVFFSITKNEEDLFKSRQNYRLCIVHSVTEEYVLIDYDKYNLLIQNKRVQCQVNFKSQE